jgi:hypothetical protein
MDYSKVLKIRPYNLDTEWMEHPANIEEINREYADAGLKRNKAKEQLEVIEAYLDLTARTGKNPDETDEHPIPYTEGLDKLPEKVTETTIKNWIKIHPRYREAQVKVFEAEHGVGILLSGTKALSAKGDALKDLTKLLLADRFSSPSSPPEKDLQAKGIERGTDMVSDRLDERLKKSVRKPIPKI